MSDLIKHLAASLPFPPVFRNPERHLKGEVVFPFYHAVSDARPPHLTHAYPVRTVKAFEKDLEFLLRHFQPVSVKQVLQTTGRNIGAPPRMVLSFDDGLIQCYETVMPILQRKGVPAVFFLNNDFIDNRGLFYRYRISLLLERLPRLEEKERKKAAEILQCRPSGLEAALRKISYPERRITDHLEELWGSSFEDYQSANPVYMSTSQIRDLIEKGFEVGAHGTDHPWFATMSGQEALEQVRKSVEDIRNRFQLDYRYFAFPFSDHGVADETIARLFKERIIDAGFGTAGWKEDRWYRYFQRIPMEFGRHTGKQLMQGEWLRGVTRKWAGRNLVDRKHQPEKAGETEQFVQTRPWRVNTLVIGAGRSGTTTLCDILEQHPDVCYSAVKEVYYFSIPDLYRRGEKYLHSFFENCTGKPVVATADTYLLIDYGAIQRIYAYNPEMKIIVILRNPVERAFSSYHYSVNYGHHKPYPRFTDSIEAEADIAEEPDVVKRNNMGHFYGGLYSRHLDQWLKVFDRSQLLILFTAELQDDPGGTVTKLLDFLELPPAELDVSRLNVHAVPRFRSLEQTLLNRESRVRRSVRKLIPSCVKNRIIRSGMVEKIFRMNRKIAPVPEISAEERRRAEAFFKKDMERLEHEYQAGGQKYLSGKDDSGSG